MIRLTGFGPFGDVLDNPSATLVRALAGRSIAGHAVDARILPVRWSDGLDAALAGPTPALLLGFGVAVSRDTVQVEAVGTRHRERADIAGREPSDVDGPERVAATVDVPRLAACLGATVSHDAGSYLCNAWAWTIPQRTQAPAAFVHLPPQGADPDGLAAGIARYLRSEGL